MAGSRALRRGVLALVAALGLASAATASPLREARPLNADDCYGLRNQIEAAFDLSPAFIMTPEAEVGLEAFGVDRACRLEFNGSGILFETLERRGFTAADEAMRAALDDASWGQTDETRTIAADGPNAALYARAKGAALCIVEVALILPEEAMAAAPLSEEALKRISIADRRYRLALSCVERDQ